MEIKILNNSLSPSFIIKTKDKNILVNTPKGFHYPLEEKIDAVIFTSDDLYHTYDIEQLKYIKRNSSIDCYIFREFIPNITKLISTNDLPLNIIQVNPYKSFEGIMPIFLHKQQLSIYSNISMGLKINKTLILPIFKTMSVNALKFMDNVDLMLLTLKYLYKEENNNSISVEELFSLIDAKDIKQLGFLGLDKDLKNTFNKEYITIGTQITV